MKLDSSPPASPPDVRRGCAPPSILDKSLGYAQITVAQAYGGAKPRLTSGGEADRVKAKMIKVIDNLY